MNTITMIGTLEHLREIAYVSIVATLDLLTCEPMETKPTIDDVVCHYLDGDTLKNALNFIDYVHASKMKIKWAGANVWAVFHRGKRVLDITIKQGAWHVSLVYDHIPLTIGFAENGAEKVKELVSMLRSDVPKQQGNRPKSGKLSALAVPSVL